MKKGRVSSKAIYTEEEIRSNRTFPTGNTVLLAIIIAVQMLLLLFLITILQYAVNPQDLDSVVPPDQIPNQPDKNN